jgi:hypothetical protein
MHFGLHMVHPRFTWTVYNLLLRAHFGPLQTCLCEYHGRASRDTLRVWNGWASTVIHGPRYESDLGLRYAPGRRPRDELAIRAGLLAALRTNLSATEPLDLRASGPTAQIVSMAAAAGIGLGVSDPAD